MGIKAELELILYKVERGEYCERFDVLSLSSVDVDGSLGDIERVTIPGLQRLHDRIISLLNSIAIENQTSLASMRTELKTCDHVISALVRGRSNNIHNVSKNHDWTSIPVADDEEYDDSESASDTDKLLNVHNNISTTDCENILNELNITARHLLESKLCAAELITLILDKYVEYMNQKAIEYHIANHSLRVEMLVRPHLLDITTHKYMDTTETRHVIEHIKHLWAIAYENGNKEVTEKILLENYYKTKYAPGRFQINWMTLKIGIAAVLLFWSISECVSNETLGSDIWNDPTYTLFVFIGDMLLLLWLWGLSITVWSKCGIDYVEILQLRDTDLIANSSHKINSSLRNSVGNSNNNYNMEEIQSNTSADIIVYSSALDFTIIYFIAFISFNKILRGSFTLEGKPAVAHAVPSCLIAYFLYKIFFPINTRMVWFKMLWSVLAAPFYPVSFRDGYIGDILTSLVRVSISLLFSVLYMVMTLYAWMFNKMKYASTMSHHLWWQESVMYTLVCIPFLTLLPGWLRLMQCLRRTVETSKRWPHFFNALKYTSALCVVSFGVFRPHIQGKFWWALGLLCATVYQFIWDITMDWGLVSYGANGNIVIRRERLLGSLWIYIAIMMVNLVLRFSWAIVLLPEQLSTQSMLFDYISTNFQTFMAAAEIVRRMIWGFIRLEWEHIEKFGTSKNVTEGRNYEILHSKSSVIEMMDIKSGLNPESKHDRMLSSNMNQFESSKDKSNNNNQFHWISYFPFIVTYFDENAQRWYDNHHRYNDRDSAVWVERLVEAILLASAVLLVFAIAALPDILHHLGLYHNGNHFGEHMHSNRFMI